jgi:transposase InsO family protein
MATRDITHEGSDDGYISDAFNTAAKRSQGQLGTQQGGSRAVEGPRQGNQGVINPGHSDNTPSTASARINGESSHDMQRKPSVTPEVKSRAHISEYIHYEMEAEGIESRGVDAPEAEWDLGDSLNLLVGRSPSKSSPLNKALPIGTCEVHAQTCYVPHKGTNIQGSPEFQEKIYQVCLKYSHVFNTKLNKQPANVPPMELHINTDMWETNKNKGPPRQQTQEKQAEIKKQCDIMLSQNIIQISQAEYYSHVHMTPKPHQVPSTTTPTKWRFCCDFRKHNMATQSVWGQPIPNIAQALQRLGALRPKYFGKIDLTSGYHQAPLSMNSRKFTAFITFMGIFEWLRVPMGIKGAPSYFQGIMATIVLIGLLYTVCELYLDDILIHATTEGEFLIRLDLVLARLDKHRITANPEKVFLGMSSVEFVGHTIDENGLSFSREKIDKVLEIEPPVFGKQLKSFLGVTVYFKDHIQNYSDKVRVLHEMIRNYDKTKSKRLMWSTVTTLAFDDIREEVNTLPVLFFLDDTSPIFLQTDASDYGIGAFLYQVVDGKNRPIAFMSRMLSERERDWTTIQKECYAIVYSFHKFYYLIRDRKFTLQTDHKNLVYMDTDTDGKVMRWKMTIQEFDCDVEHIPGKDNVVADGFSRLLAITEEELTAMYDLHIPVKYQDKIKKVHNSVSGHHGVQRTIDKLDAMGPEFDWKYRREHVKKFIKQCPFCQKMSYLKPSVHTHPFTVAAYHPMERLGMDSIGPLLPSKDGYQYILVIIDCFTRWVELYPLTDLAAIPTAKVLMQHFGRFGNPAQVIHDNATQFENESINEIIRLTGIETIPILAYSSEENAIVERANKEVMRHLRAIIFDKNIISNWQDFLPIVQRIINATKNESTGVAPDQLLFGNAIKLDRGVFLPQSENPASSISLSKWAADMLKAQHDITGIAQRAQLLRDQQHMAESSPQRTEFAIGSYVLVNYHGTALRAGPPSKMQTYLRGPLKVLSVNVNTYTLENLISHKSELVHVTDIRPFNYDPNMTDPATVARKDIISETLIERILEHSGDVKKRTTLDFKVRWEGQPATNDLWLQYKELRDNEQLHTYLRANGMSNLIPEKFNEPKPPKAIQPRTKR